MQHAMIDIETLSTKRNAVFLSLAAIQFDPDTGNIGEKFYMNIDLQSAADVDLVVDASTVLWWMKQRPNIFSMMFKDAQSIHTVLADFSNWMLANDIQQVWGNSAAFDLGILGNGYDAIGMDRPWSYSGERCFRTMKALFPQYIEGMKFDGSLEHDPVYDCEKQIYQLIEIMRNLKPKKNGTYSSEEQQDIPGRTGS